MPGITWDGFGKKSREHDVKMDFPVDLNGYRTRMGAWLNDMALNLPPGRFRYCSRGSRVPENGPRGAVASCFALKTAWTCDLASEWPAERLTGALDFLAGFQRPEGYFEDPWLLHPARAPWKVYANALLRRCAWPQNPRRLAGLNKIADTRQNASVLLQYDRLAPYPLPARLTAPELAERYFNSLNWQQPWGSGSHLSHEIFFLAANARMGVVGVDYPEIAKTVLTLLQGIRHPEDGCWYVGKIPDAMKINGAMKIFSLLNWLDEPWPDCSALLPFALKQPFIDDGCGFLNRLYVVWNACRGGDAAAYREPIRKLVQDALTHLKHFERADGGFSFLAAGAERKYFGCEVSAGDPVGDMHGAVMLTWALALCSELAPELVTGAEHWHPMRT